MRETLALTLLDLRLHARQPATPVWAALPLAALILGALVSGPRGPSLAAAWSACVLGVLALLVAAASAAQLPDDRESGRAPWLASLAPAPRARRMGAALAGWALALAAALAGALLVGLLAPALSLTRPLRDAAPLAAPRRLEAGAQAGWHEVRLARALERASTLDVSVGHAVAAGAGRVDWVADGAAGRVDVPRGGRLALDLPAGARDVRLALDAAGLTWREGRLLGRERSWLGSWTWVGLLLGLGAGWFALTAVAVSRWTSAATAALAVVALVLLAAMRGVLPDLAGLPGLTPVQDAARVLLERALFLAPDLSGLAAALDPAAGRAVGPAALGGLAPLAPHALASLLLLLPSRDVRAEAGA